MFDYKIKANFQRITENINPFHILSTKRVISVTYRGIKPFANSKNGILCDFVPPIVIIKMSAVKHVPTLASTINIP